MQEEHYQSEEQELEHEDFDHANYPNEENSYDNYEWMQQDITHDIERERYKDWLYQRGPFAPETLWNVSARTASGARRDDIAPSSSARFPA